MAQQGDGVLLHPPGNTGSVHGAGIISGNDGETYTFKTPDGTKDNPDGTKAVLNFPGIVFFDILEGNTVHNVSHENTGPIGGTTDNPLGQG